MLAFNSVEKAPGVYMQEIDVPGPIAGVSTGVVAVVGPASSGPINTPVFVTNWTQFLETFGGYIYDPLVYAPLAVRGFFDNGGAVCCFVRAGMARSGSLVVGDRSAGAFPVFAVTARAEGEPGNDIAVTVKDAWLCETDALRCVADVELISADRSRLYVGGFGEAALFVPGDVVCVSQGGLAEEAEVVFVSDEKKEIVLNAGLVKGFSKDNPEPVSVRLADLKGKKRVRLDSVDGLEPGSYLEFSQDGGLTEYAVAERLDGRAVLLRSALTKGFGLAAADGVVRVRSIEFSLEIVCDGKKEEYLDLSMVPYHSRYYEKHTADSVFVSIEPSDSPNPSQAPFNLPALIGGVNLKDGRKDEPGGLTQEHYLSAIEALERVSVNIVCVPDMVSFGPGDVYKTVLQYLVNHCERMGNRFAVLDCSRNLPVMDVLKQRKECYGSSSYAAVYYPWIEISHPTGQGRIKMPPSGHIAGVYARTDDQKGVHKAPGNEIIKGSLGPAMVLNATEHGLLNEASVNAIVNVPGSGTTIMGARTLSNSTQWRYINVRRLLLYIEESIENATRFAVFLPNNLSLWATVKRQVSGFLNGVWRSGALFGATADQAFHVKVDEELNPPGVRALGQLIIEVVVYPVTPAEFIVFRIIQQPGGPVVSE